jgi:hypothetical protein
MRRGERFTDPHAGARVGDEVAMRREETDEPMTSKANAHDPETGEVHERPFTPRRGSFGRRVYTSEEQADAKRVREERAELRRQEVAALCAIDPACETEDDPPVVWRKPNRIAEPTGLLLDLPRLSGRGLPGSRLVLAPRYYDGAGPNGGEAHHYVTAFPVFRDTTGHLRRFVGAAIHRSELRAVASALVSYADSLDALDAEGEP